MMGGGGMMNGFGFGGMGLFGGWIGLIFNLAIIVGIVIMVVWAVKRLLAALSTAIRPLATNPRVKSYRVAMHAARSLAISTSRY